MVTFADQGFDTSKVYQINQMLTTLVFYPMIFSIFPCSFIYENCRCSDAKFACKYIIIYTNRILNTPNSHLSDRLGRMIGTESLHFKRI